MSPRQLVLDCSAALSLFLADEASEAVEAVVADTGVDGKLWVPAHWWPELANALVAAQRSERLRAADADRAIEAVTRLPLYVDPMLGPRAIERMTALAHTHKLTAYDAAYLELAQRRGVPLMTLDRDLRNAAARAGVERLPLEQGKSTR